MDDDKDYQKSEFAKRVEELMDDGFEFGEAVKEAMKEGYKDGGSIGIEVLFKPKVPAAPSQLVSESDILLGYRGDAAYRSGSEQSKSIGQGNVGSKASFGGGKGVDRSGRDEGAGGADRSKVTQEQNINQLKNQLGIKDPNLLQKTFQKYDALPLPIKGAINTMAPAELMKIFNIGNVINKGVNAFKDPVLTEEDVTLGATEEISFKGNSPFMRNQINERIIAAENEYLKQGKMPPEFLGDKIRMNMELGNYKGYMGPGFEDGGRVGLFMGGPALTGQPLAIFNSMNAYGFSDQEIADAIREAGYELPTADSDTTSSDSRSVTQSLGIVDKPYAGQVVDQTDYSFKPQNYRPGGKLEIDPAALGMSFYDAEPKQAPEGFIGKTIDAFTSVPGKQLSSFTTPTGVTPRGPAELGFMSKQISPGIPMSRDQIRAMYDNYNQFIGRKSNYASARVPGKLDSLAKTALSTISQVPFIGSAIDKMQRGDVGLQSKYTVDNAGFGNTGTRDEFGLATFDKKDGFLGLTGTTTRDYVDRMNERLNELDDFFGERIEGFDMDNLTPEMLASMGKINGFYTKQVQAYKQRIAKEEFERKEKERIRIEEYKKSQTKKEADAIQNKIDKQEDKINENASKNDAPSGASIVNPNSDYGKKKGYTGGSHNPHTSTGWSGSSKNGGGGGGKKGGGGGSLSGGGFCFDPNTLVQMADGTEKKIKEIQLGDNTKGGEVTGVFQFKAADEIHDYKGVTVAGSHFVKEDGRFIMVQDSPLSVKIDKIPVVYSLDTTGRRIFINDIEFADYNGDGVAKNFLTNAGVDLTGFDTEVLRQVEQRLI